MEIKLKDHTKTDTLRHRETAQQILKTINQQPDKQVTLDFKDITFTSRAFIHELLTGLQNHQTHLKNTNHQTRQIIQTIHTKPKLDLKTPKKPKKLNP